jgi:outer membrane protein assembly factor BamD
MTQIRFAPSRLAQFGALFLLALPLALGGCSHFLNSSPKPGTEEAMDEANMPSAQVLYSQGLAEMQQGNYDRAVTKFNEIDANYPYSTWSTHAELLAGYAQYKNQDYDSAIASLSRYIALHPTDDEAAYAYYLKALCYYEQIDDVQRDQSATYESISALGDVITRYPDSAYARDARIKLRLADNRLAGHEMVIGRYYEKQHLYAAAIGRYQDVIQTFQTTTYIPEALERTTECYLDLGLTGAAQRTASVLAFNYPGSPWYQIAYNTLLEHNLVADAQTPPPPKKHGWF